MLRRSLLTTRPVRTNSKWLEDKNNNQMNGHMTWRSSVLKMFVK